VIKIIELWKTNCFDCEAVKSIVTELENEGYQFEKYNITDSDGEKLWDKYAKEIDAYSKSQGWEEGYIYTPTFINPANNSVMAYSDRPPTKKELIKFSKGN